MGGAGAGAGVGAGSGGGDANVRVLVRARPLNALERERNGDETCITLDGNAVRLSKTDARIAFDHVFGPDTTQDHVFAQVGPASVADVLSGYNATVFAYGQTASGKTFTMLGPPDEGFSSPDAGLIPRIISALFDGVRRLDPNVEVSIKVMYVEIYLETVRDLLEPSSINLEIREDKDRGVFVDKARSVFVGSPEEMMEVVTRGSENRRLAFTGMNADSSRSHSVLLTTVIQRDSVNESQKQGRLVLVDLAGSESVGKTGAVGEQLQEAKMINKSLTTLNLVIKHLCEKKPHIPYRDSKLTRMLQESLGGNARTTLIICVSMSKFNTAETTSTIRFGSSAKTIKNKPRVNVSKSVKELEDALEAANKQIARQAVVLESQRVAIERYQGLLRQNHIEDTVATGVYQGTPARGASAGSSKSRPTTSTGPKDPEAQAQAQSAEGQAAPSGTQPEVASPAVVAVGPNLQLRILELEDLVKDLRAALADREDKLASRAQELLGLSTSLLEKEQMLKSAGLGEAHDTAVTRASHNVMMEELDEIKGVKCKICNTRPFERAMALSDLPLLHEQSCVDALENRQAVKRLNSDNASLKAEVDSLKNYIESAAVRMMEEDEASVRAAASPFPSPSPPTSPRGGHRRVPTGGRDVEMELAKLKATNADLHAEVARLQKSARDDAGRAGGDVSARVAALQRELDIKASAIINVNAELATARAVAADLEEQLRNAGDASTVRQLERQLRQTVLVHRQMLRKIAVVDQECIEAVEKVEARDRRINDLNRQILQLNEALREQADWHTLQMSQHRVTHMQEIERLRRQVTALESALDGGGGGGAAGAAVVSRSIRSSGLAAWRSVARPVNS